MSPRLAVTLLLAFTVTLAAVIGSRMSEEAMTVVIGVVFGVAAGLPASLLIASFSVRRERAYSAPVRVVERTEPARMEPSMDTNWPMQQAQQPYGWGRPSQYPPVIVVTPGMGQGQMSAANFAPSWGGMMPQPMMPQRQIQVIGGELEGGEGA